MLTVEEAKLCADVAEHYPKNDASLWGVGTLAIRDGSLAVRCLREQTAKVEDG